VRDPLILLRATENKGQLTTLLRCKLRNVGRTSHGCRRLTQPVTSNYGRRSSGIAGHADSATRNRQTSSISILFHGQKQSKETAAVSEKVGHSSEFSHNAVDDAQQ
jgi:hypothetical protein